MKIELVDIVYSFGFSTLMLTMNYMISRYDANIKVINLNMINFLIGCIGSIALSIIIKNRKPKTINTTKGISSNKNK